MLSIPNGYYRLYSSCGHDLRVNSQQLIEVRNRMMEPFEDWYESKLKLIYGAMKRLKIRGNRDEFYQVGLIALWEASKRYDDTVGTFDVYAYSYILNRMKSAMTRENSYQNRYCPVDHEMLEDSRQTVIQPEVMMSLMMPCYLKCLTAKQNEVIVERYVLNHDVKTTANRLGISVDAVKNRTRDALKKMRLSLENE